MNQAVRRRRVVQADVSGNVQQEYTYAWKSAAKRAIFGLLKTFCLRVCARSPYTFIVYQQKHKENS